MYYVYRFLDKSKNVIYVGKSKQDLEQRFRGHLHLPDECYDLVYKIEYIECLTESDMSIKEIYYINKYRNENFYFNVLDIAELPTSVVFNDKWKMYKGPLGAHFHKSINYKKGYTSEKQIRYNKDGSVDKRKTNKEKGDSSFVEGFTKDEVDLIIIQLINAINNATNENQKQICFRNLMMFIVAVNVPLKTPDFLKLKYKDLFDPNDNIKPIEMQLGRYYKDSIIKVPLRDCVKKVVLAYTKKYGLTFDNNSEEFLFLSRKHQVVSLVSWGRILSDTAKAAKINKNIGTESIRKTYGINVYERSEDKLNALLFLGELWGHIREAQMIRFLNLAEDKIDFDYYFGESYTLGDFKLEELYSLNTYSSAQKQMQKPKQPIEWNKSESSLKIDDSPKTKKRTKKKQPPKTNRVWSIEKKIEIVEKNLIQKIPQKVLAKEYDVDAGAISRWISSYKQYGESGLIDKRYKK